MEPSSPCSNSNWNVPWGPCFLCRPLNYRCGFPTSLSQWAWRWTLCSSWYSLPLPDFLPSLWSKAHSHSFESVMALSRCTHLLTLRSLPLIAKGFIAKGFTITLIYTAPALINDFKIRTDDYSNTQVCQFLEFFSFSDIFLSTTSSLILMVTL